MGDRSGILIHRRTGLAASLLLTACCLLGQAVAAQRHVTSGPCCLVGQVVIDEGHSWSDVSPDVESIHIDNPTPSDAAALPKHAKLNEVTIRCGTNEDDSGDSADTIKVVQALADLPELRTVSVWWCSGKQPLFEALARLKTVTRIDVSGCFELDPLALEMLAKSEKLTYLSLSTINNFGDAHIKAIAKLENLEQLSIETDGVWNTIDKSTRRRKLGRKPADALLPLGSLRHLKALSIGWAKVSAASMHAIAAIPTLEALSLFKCYDVDADVLAQLAACKTLRVLDLGYDACCVLPDLDDACIDAISKFANLETLWLRRRTEITVARLAKIIEGCPKLGEVCLPGAVFTSEVARQLAQTASVRTLILTEANAIAPEALNKLSSYATLQSLGLEQVSESALRAVPWSEMVHLNTLGLDWSRASDFNVDTLSRIATSPVLRTINNRFSESELPAPAAFATLNKCRSLQSVGVFRMDWSVEDLRLIADALDSATLVAMGIGCW